MITTWENEERDLHYGLYSSDEDKIEEEGEEEGEQEDSDAYDEFEEFTWLKSIKIYFRAEETPNTRVIGYCQANLIDRDRIRGTFYRAVEKLTRDLCELAFSLFDRWGNLKREFRSHPVKRGTGVWANEINDGKFLLIEELTIDENHRRKGHGRKLLSAAHGVNALKIVCSRSQGIPIRQLVLSDSCPLFLASAISNLACSSFCKGCTNW